MKPTKVNTSHGVTVGDTVIAAPGKMEGVVKSILAYKFWSNGGVPMAVIQWESGSTSRLTITKLEVVKKVTDTN